MLTIRQTATFQRWQRKLRVHFGPGYRVYFKKVGDEIVVLLCGGDKSSQARDIEKAKRLTSELGEL